MGINLENMTRKDLVDLRDQVEKALKGAEARERKQALKAAEKAAAEFGFSLSELSPTAAGAAGSTKARAKYCNPADPTQTWTGRGRKPRWVHEALASGSDITDLEI